MEPGIMLLIGTTKGAFLMRGDPTRRGWTLTGPHCDGWGINHMLGQPESGTILAAGGGDFVGAGVWRSHDGGATWELFKLANGKSDDWARENPEIAAQLGISPAPPAPYTGEITALWSLGASNGTLYAGAKPAMLFESRDGGATWGRVSALTGHPSRDSWNPGAAGLILHTIVADPEAPGKLWVGISAAGIFATEDGGISWERRNRRSNAGAAHVPHAGHPAAGDSTEIGHCVHNMVRAAATPGDLLYQQNHCGVYRSPDGGRTWDDIAEGLPSTFGFPIAVHPEKPQTIWTLPLNGDSAGRYPPGARAAVWRSRDGGDTWEDLHAGLPQENCFFTVLRQAMATDRGLPGALYFGTNTGSVFASLDEGDTWDEIARHLPTILCVETLAAA